MPNPTQLVAVPLRKDVKSPLAARNDAENPALDTTEKTRRRREKPKKKPTTRRLTRKTTEEAAEKPRRRPATAPAPANVDIDLERFEARAVVLPPQGGQLRGPAGRQGQAALPPRAAHRLGTTRRAPSSTSISRSAKRRPCSTMPTAFEATADGKKMLVVEQEEVRDRRGQGEAEVREADGDRGHRGAGRSARRMAADVHATSYRFERDFFYDPGMHGVNWDGDCSERYGKLLDDAVTRWDVELPDRRVHRRAERVAHLSRRRRQGAGAAAVGRHARRRLGAGRTARTASSASSAADRGTRRCARRSTSRA